MLKIQGVSWYLEIYSRNGNVKSIPCEVGLPASDAHDTSLFFTPSLPSVPCSPSSFAQVPKILRTYSTKSTSYGIHFTFPFSAVDFKISRHNLCCEHNSILIHVLYMIGVVSPWRWPIRDRNMLKAKCFKHETVSLDICAFRGIFV